MSKRLGWEDLLYAVSEAVQVTVAAFGIGAAVAVVLTPVVVAAVVLMLAVKEILL